MIAIDPGFGVRSGGCACARLLDGRVIAVWFTRAAHPGVPAAAHTPAPRLIVWECPDADSRGAPPRTLIQLAAAGATVAGYCAGLFGGAEVVPVSADSWTRGEPKPQRHRRLWAGLDAGERALLGGPPTLEGIQAACEAGALERWKRPGGAYYPAGFRVHNLLDAVALGKGSRA